MCVCARARSHRVSAADVFAGCLDDGLAGLVERSVDAVVGSGVGRLNQSLQLQRKRTFRKMLNVSSRIIILYFLC